jgi:hypothetical protein
MDKPVEVCAGPIAGAHLKTVIEFRHPGPEPARTDPPRRTTDLAVNQHHALRKLAGNGLHVGRYLRLQIHFCLLEGFSQLFPNFPGRTRLGTPGRARYRPARILVEVTGKMQELSGVTSEGYTETPKAVEIARSAKPAPESPPRSRLRPPPSSLSRQRSRVRVSSSPPYFPKTYGLAVARPGCS